MDPERLERLIAGSNMQYLQRYSSMPDMLVSIRRSAGSSLRNSDGSVIPLRQIMPSYQVWTAELVFTLE